MLAYKNGSCDTTTWTAAGVLVWWTLGLFVVSVSLDINRVVRARDQRIAYRSRGSQRRWVDELEPTPDDAATVRVLAYFLPEREGV